MKESTTQRKTSTDYTSKDRMVDMDELVESAYIAVMVGLSHNIKQGKDRLTKLVQEYDGGKAKYCAEGSKSKKTKIYKTRYCCPKYQESS